MYCKDYLVKKGVENADFKEVIETIGNPSKQAISMSNKKPESKENLLLKELNLSKQLKIYRTKALGYEQVSIEKIRYGLDCNEVRWYSVKDYPNIIPIECIEKYKKAINIFRSVWVVHPKPHTCKVMMVGQINSSDSENSIYFNIVDWRN